MSEEFLAESGVSDDLRALADIQADREDDLLSLSNVVGVGLGTKVTDDVDTGESCVKVLVTQKLDDARLLPSGQRIPKTIQKMPTDVAAVGEIFAGGAADDELAARPVAEDVSPLSLTQRVRPALGGYSIGHFRVTAGTAGSGCYDLTPFPSKPPQYYILSNNHVLANSNNSGIGDPILQPGRVDGGVVPGDVIAKLARFVPIRFDGSCNFVDAAVAETRFESFDRRIYYIGYTQSLGVAPQVGMIVKKTGRTTNFTTGMIRVINATVNVNYGEGRVARFCRQIVTTDMSAPGDSGSLVLDQQNNPVGLLFAGSPVATILNQINFVQALLRVRLWP